MGEVHEVKEVEKEDGGLGLAGGEHECEAGDGV
jgi:hypothetical protein